MILRTKNSQKSGGIEVNRVLRSSRLKSQQEKLFWDKEGIIMIDYLQKGKTINADYYTSLLDQLKQKLKEKRRGKLSNGVLFLQDKASSHKAHRTMQKFDQIGFELLHHPPYSPDLAPSDYHLQLKKYLKGTKFASDNEVIQATEA